MSNSNIDPPGAESDTFFINSLRHLLGALCIRHANRLADALLARVHAKTADLTDEEVTNLILDRFRSSLMNLLDSPGLRAEIERRVPTGRQTFAKQQTHQDLAAAIRSLGVRLQRRHR